MVVKVWQDLYCLHRVGIHPRSGAVPNLAWASFLLMERQGLYMLLDYFYLPTPLSTTNQSAIPDSAKVRFLAV
jgi:hypothetical protein